MKVPENHQTVMPYLILKDAAEFICFTEDVFKARQLVVHYRDGESKAIMHAEIQIGNSTLMLAEATENYIAQTANMFIYVNSADEAYNNALAHGAKAETPLADLEYGRSGGIRDAFGNVWWITSL